MYIHYRVSACIHLANLGLRKPLEFSLQDDKVRISASAAGGRNDSNLFGVAETIEACSPEMMTLLDEATHGRALEPPARNKQLLAFCRALDARLGRHLEDVVSALRWRCGVSDGPLSPLSDATYEFSIDGAEWRSIPRYAASARIRFSRARRNLVEDEIQAGVADLLVRGKDEPLGYQLLREALELRKTHPRSALVIGIAAIEVGFKHFVADLVPDAAWLAIEAPSPPLDRMLREYLPKLPVRGKFEGRYALIPQKLINVLGEGMKARNKLAHSGKFLPDADELENLLHTINDLLLLFDCYSGERWALDHIDAESTQALVEAISKQRQRVT
jgi:hypothetical protein